METRLSEKEINAMAMTLIKQETGALETLCAPVNSHTSVSELIELVKTALLYLEGKDEFYFLQNSDFTGLKNHFLFFASHGYATEIPDEPDEKNYDKIIDITSVIKNKLQEIEKNGNNQNLLERLYPRDGTFNLFSFIYPGEKTDPSHLDEKLIYPFQKYDAVEETKLHKLTFTDPNQSVYYLKTNVEISCTNMRPFEVAHKYLKKYISDQRDNIIPIIDNERKQENKQTSPLKPNHKQKPRSPKL